MLSLQLRSNHFHLQLGEHPNTQLGQSYWLILLIIRRNKSIIIIHINSAVTLPFPKQWMESLQQHTTAKQARPDEPRKYFAWTCRMTASPSHPHCLAHHTKKECNKQRRDINRKWGSKINQCRMTNKALYAFSTLWMTELVSKSQFMWLYQNPSIGLCGSLSESQYWWWYRWVLTQSNGFPCFINK